MLGLSKELSAKLEQRGYSESDLAQLFGPKSWKGQLRIVYQQPNGDLSSALPSNRHVTYLAKGWTAVDVVDDSTPSTQPDEVPPPTVAALASGDLLALYSKGDAAAIFDTRHHARLSSKGFAFVRPATPRELYQLRQGSKPLSLEEQRIADSLPHVDSEIPKAAKK